MEILEKVEKLKQELDALRPIDPAAEDRIMQKLRLDWNYHSNKLEGNTYSFGETKMLLLKGLTAGGKPVRDHEEISGHNEAINIITEYIRAGEPLTEIFIRQLHTLILVRPFWADAKTVDGVPTKRLIKVGEYKTEPNHVETQTGEMFYFAEPIETPAKMQELVEWFRVKAESPEANPILLAAEFHYRFVLIHPFDDGNGRLARLLMNFILMKFGYPPVIIKNEDKDNYIAALEQANFTILEPFIKYIGQNLIRSLEIMIKGAEGKDIEEPEDLDKELALLEQKLKAQTENSGIEKTQESLLNLFDNSIVPLFLELTQVSRKFATFYYENQPSMFIDSHGHSDVDENKISSQMKERLTTSNFFIHLQHKHRRFKTGDNIDYEISLEIKLDPKKFIVKNSDNQIVLEKSYSDQLSLEEIRILVNFEAKKHKEFIDKNLTKSS